MPRPKSRPKAGKAGILADLKALRGRLGLSQKQLGELCGVHVMTVSKWERGLLAPNAHQQRLLQALGDAAERGVRASPARSGGKRGSGAESGRDAGHDAGHDPVRFLAAALSEAQAGPRIDLGALSATNRFPGKVVEVARGDVMSKVVVEVAPGVRIGSVITTDSVQRLGLEVGVQAIAIIKATEVILGRS